LNVSAGFELNFLANRLPGLYFLSDSGRGEGERWRSR
jgi:hypothetical protein